MDLFNSVEISSNAHQIPSKFRRNFVNCVFQFLKFRRNFVQMSGFRVSQQGASVWWLPAALRRPQKKHAPGILEDVSCVFCRCLLMFYDCKCFCRFWGLPPGCLRRFGDLRKNTPWISGACILCVFLSFLTISGSGTRGDLRSVRGGNQEQG